MTDTDITFRNENFSLIFFVFIFYILTSYGSMRESLSTTKTFSEEGREMN